MGWFPPTAKWVGLCKTVCHKHPLTWLARGREWGVNQQPTSLPTLFWDSNLSSRESSVELRELESKLKQAYINKELYGQLSERRKREKLKEEQVWASYWCWVIWPKVNWSNNIMVKDIAPIPSSNSPTIPLTDGNITGWATDDLTI